ncbi:GARP transcription factor [Trema orientale]|uniref:GARP transcription factor n=1 Tax=Trema orientale TaxID=63057 RepID=A0A2P5FZ46_TREOI|nr:GARP transcription factor [Trema orientale]
MGSIPSELSLDFRASFVPKTIHDFLKEVSSIGNVPERASKLDDFVRRLEDEMKKIDAFKRELPLCMILLNDAILALKEESAQCGALNAQPVLEEFIPLKKDCEEHEEITKNNKNEKDSRDKKNWMSSVQLWNTDDFPTSDITTKDLKQNSKTQTKINEKRYALETQDPFQSCRNRTTGRAFVPFHKPYSSFPATVVRKDDKDEFPVHGLSLLTPGLKSPKEESGCGGVRSTSGSGRAVSSSPANVQSNPRTGSQQPQQQAARKQRRCWSPELHRRFVNALQQLGGSQVATPKQIRELMQVDGLTNDEVKSHLQKYRLHTRRLPSGTSAAPANQPVVVLGGLWMSPDQYGDSSKASSSQSGSPQGPLQLAATRGGSPTTGEDYSMEDDEDAKSEGYSWKTHIHKPVKDDV